MDERFAKLLRLYCSGKLTQKDMKDAMAAAADEEDIRREAERLRKLIVRLKFAAAVKDDARFLKDVWRILKPECWQEDGGGI